MSAKAKGSRALPKLKDYMATLKPTRRRSPKKLVVTWDADRLALTITPPPPSANTMGNWHWRTKMRYRDTLLGHLQCLTLPTFAGPVEVVHVWRLVGQARDPDNCVYGLKPVFDCLQKVGMVANDRQFLPTFGGQQAGGKGAKTQQGVTLVFLGAVAP